MKMKYLLLTALSLAVLPTTLTATESKKAEIHFAKGESQKIVTGKVTGHNSVVYKINAKNGQWLKVEMLPGVKGADFTIYIPGKKIGEDALFNSLVGDRKYLGQLYKNGNHTIEVFLNRAAARRNETHNYRMLVSLTNSKPGTEEVPSTGPVPQKVINDCLASLKKQIPNRKMKVVSSKRGENSFIIDVKVDGVKKLWRCYHDGTKCTGTEYQGEG